jgi:hypothetical protein
MTGVRHVVAALTLLVLAGGSAMAQPPVDSPETTAPRVEEAVASRWSWTVSVFTYLLPDEDNYGQPTVSLDRDWLHVEGRLNYEDLSTGSVWAGYNVSVGDAVTFEITPMMGAIFGDTTGLGVGYKGSVAWRSVDVSSETEFVFDTESSADNFLYTWSELGWTPVSWLRTGLAVQRTKVYQTEFDIQRGVFAAVSLRRAEVSAYLFNPDADPTVVIGVSLAF